MFKIKIRILLSSSLYLSLYLSLFISIFLYLWEILKKEKNFNYILTFLLAEKWVGWLWKYSRNVKNKSQDFWKQNFSPFTRPWSWHYKVWALQHLNFKEIQPSEKIAGTIGVNDLRVGFDIRLWFYSVRQSLSLSLSIS